MFPIFWQKEKRERQERERKKGKREREKQGKMQSNRAFFLVGKKKKVNPGFWTGFKHSLTAYRRIYTEHA